MIRSDCRWALLAALAGCAELQELPPETCGNGVREGGEACDTFERAGFECAPASDLARACRFICDGEQSCPSGWACGDGGVCNAPSGRFVMGTKLPLACEGLLVGDLDGDGRSDLVGSNALGMEVRYGEPEGFSAGLWRPFGAPEHTRLALGDADGDGLLDVALSQPTGVGLLHSRGRGFATALFATLPLAEQELSWPVAVRADGAAQTDTVMLFVSPTQGGTIVYQVTLPYLGGTDGELDLPFDLDGVSAIPRADLEGDGGEEVVVAVPGTRDLYLVGASDSGPVVTTRTVGWRDDLIGDARALVTDLEGDGHQEILVQVSGRVWVERGDGTSSYDPRFDALPFPLLARDLSHPPDGEAELVLPDGVYRAEGEALLRVHAFSDEISEAVSGDFDGDGSQDLAVSISGAPSLRMLFNNGLLTPLEVPLEAPPRALRLGDFDGFGPDDVALLERVAADQDRLTIVFGAAGAPPSATSFGALPGAVRLETANLQVVSSVLPDGATDLLLLTAAIEDRPGFGSLILGSPSRALDAPLTLQIQNVVHEPQRVLLGNFREGQEVEGVAVAIDPRLPENDPRWWLVSPSDVAHPVKVQGWVDSGQRPACAVWLRGDVDADGWDEIVVITTDSACAEPSLAVIDLSPQWPVVGADFLKTVWPVSAAARAARLADLDQDGAADLVTLEDHTVVVRWGPDLAQSSATAAPAGSHALVDLEATRMPGRELALLGEGEVHLLGLAPGRALTPVTGPLMAPRGHAIEAADVSGDGVDDLLIADGAEVTLLIAEAQ